MPASTFTVSREDIYDYERCPKIVSSPRRNSSPAHYTKMAGYYDALYSKIMDYPSQVDYLEKIFTKHRRKRPESILDVACGTGNYTFIFAKRGYRSTGIYISDEMLRIATKQLQSSSIL